jgi:hypothetical protein
MTVSEPLEGFNSKRSHDRMPTTILNGCNEEVEPSSRSVPAGFKAIYSALAILDLDL